jgi:nucleotide-binding universal stress UspA family protein
MFRRLVVPLDGSELAEHSLPYAEALASANGGRLVLVRVSDAADEAEAYLAEIAGKLRPRVAVETRVLQGRAASRIVEAVAAVEADAVVMATHGRTGVGHLVRGSVTEGVIADGDVPVFVAYARDGEMPPPPFDPARARVIVPLDGSELAEAALAPAVNLLGTAGELVLMFVVSLPDHVELDQTGRTIAYLDQQAESQKRRARDYLHVVRKRITSANPGLQVSLDVRFGDPATSIVDASVEHVADLVVMASHGRTGISRAVHGSVTGAVVREGITPVLVVHPHVAAMAATAPVR